MLRKYTTNEIKQRVKKCSKCGKKIAIAHVVDGKLLCTKCKETANAEQTSTS